MKRILISALAALQVVVIVVLGGADLTETGLVLALTYGWALFIFCAVYFAPHWEEPA